MNTFRDTLSFSGSHPVFAGHFPENPIVPGALILSEISEMVTRRLGRNVSGVRVAKFHHPLVPDTEYLVRLLQNSPGEITFTCMGGDTMMSSGTLLVTTP
jgi:3-hydroxyacyl-[acyl-carrier-protein] dehydratase